jgi:hypothetical protein
MIFLLFYSVITILIKSSTRFSLKLKKIYYITTFNILRKFKQLFCSTLIIDKVRRIIISSESDFFLFLSEYLIAIARERARETVWEHSNCLNNAKARMICRFLFFRYSDRHCINNYVRRYLTMFSVCYILTSSIPFKKDPSKYKKKKKDVITY